MNITELESWIREKIASINRDIEMDKECKKEGYPIPFGNDNERWLEQIKDRKDAFEEVIAHIECDRLNKAIHLAIALDEGE